MYIIIDAKEIHKNLCTFNSAQSQPEIPNPKTLPLIKKSIIRKEFMKWAIDLKTLDIGIFRYILYQEVINHMVDSRNRSLYSDIRH